MKLELVAPSTDYKESYLKALTAFRSEGILWYENLDVTDFDRYVDDLNASREKTSFWAIIGNEFAGKIHLWHELTPELRRIGGHIGYDTAPEFRGKGVATEMLRKVLPFAKTIGLIEVLLTCDDTNIASIKVIEKNGGVLKEKKTISEGKPLKRYYWIPLN